MNPRKLTIISVVNVDFGQNFLSNRFFFLELNPLIKGY